MTKAIPLLAVASAALMTGVVLTARALSGADGAPWSGIAVGSALGVAFTAGEVVLLHRATMSGSPLATRIQGAAAALRVFLLFAVGLLLQSSELADAGAFAVTFAGAFLAGLPWIAYTVHASSPRRARP